jgi:hypothetical protein
MACLCPRASTFLDFHTQDKPLSVAVLDIEGVSESAAKNVQDYLN